MVPHAEPKSNNRRHEHHDRARTQEVAQVLLAGGLAGEGAGGLGVSGRGIAGGPDLQAIGAPALTFEPAALPGGESIWLFFPPAAPAGNRG